MDGRRFFSGLQKLLRRKSSGASNTRSALTTRPSSRQSVVENSRCDTIGDVITVPPSFERSELDRLVFEQGLTSPRATSAIEKRQIRDKSYYMGLLFRKGYQVRSEVQKLLQDSEKMIVDQMAYDGLKAAAEAKALELKRLQESLWEYNILDEWQTIGKSLQEAKSEWEELKSENSDSVQEVNSLFDKVKQMSEMVRELEVDLSQRDHVTDILTAERCEELKEQDREVRSELTQLEMKMRRLASRKTNLESRCDQRCRGGAMGFLQELNSKESKLDTLKKEQALVSRSENCQLVKKEYTHLIRCIRNQIRDVKGMIEKARSELRESSVDGKTNTRADTILKLKDRERVLESFFESFPSRKNAQLDECRGHQRRVLSLLEDASWKLNCGFEACRDSGGSMRDALRKELASLMEKEALEDNLLQEVANLKKELKEKEDEIRKFLDLEALRASKRNRKRELNSELTNLKEKREVWMGVLQTLEGRRDWPRDATRGYKVREELSKLEKRWHELEEENFSLKEWLEEEKVKGDYSLVKEDVLRTVRELNEVLGSAKSPVLF